LRYPKPRAIRNSDSLYRFLIFVRQLRADLGPLIQVLLGQTQGLIVQAPDGSEVAVRLGEEAPRVQQPAKAPHVSGLEELLAGCEALLGGRVGDLPVAAGGAGHAQGRLQHVLLADGEGRDVGGLVLEAGQVRALVVLVIWEDFKAEHGGDSAPDLGHGAGVDLGFAVVQEDQGFLFEVEPVPVWAAPQAEFVPEPTRNTYPGTLAEFFDLVAVFSLPVAEEGIPTDFYVERVSSKLIRQHPGNACSGGSLNELGLSLGGCPHAHSDDEDILALEGLD
jgi:hypothetical protein